MCTIFNLYSKQIISFSCCLVRIPPLLITSYPRRNIFFRNIPTERFLIKPIFPLVIRFLYAFPRACAKTCPPVRTELFRPCTHSGKLTGDAKPERSGRQRKQKTKTKKTLKMRSLQPKQHLLFIS